MASPRVRAFAVLACRSVIFALLFWLWANIFWVFLEKTAWRLRYLRSPSDIMNDPPCARPECDFSQFWPAGFLARAHKFVVLYDPTKFLAYRHNLFAMTVSRIDWVYPPPMLLPSAAISFFPFEMAFAIWTLILTSGAILLLRWARIPWGVVGLTLLSPAVLWNLEMGQFSFFASCCFLAGLLMVSRQPRRAGFAFGALLLKPQIAILAPVVLLAKGNLRALATAALVASGVVLMTLIIFGTSVWRTFVQIGGPASRSILQKPFALGYQQFGISSFWMLRSFGLGLEASYICQLLLSLAGIFLCWKLWRSDLDLTIQVEMTVFLSLLVTPYGFTYDLGAYSAVIAMNVVRRGWKPNITDALFWLWPAVCPVIVMFWGLLFTPLVVAAAGWNYWQEGLAFAHASGCATGQPRKVQ